MVLANGTWHQCDDLTVETWHTHTLFQSLSLSDTPKAKEDLNRDQISHPVETKHCEIARAYMCLCMCVLGEGKEDDV